MAQEFARAFYNGKAWKHTRALYIASVFGLCERCKAKGILKPGKIVHHKIKLNKYNIHNNDIALGFNNLEYVCKDCHEAEHSEETIREGIKFDSRGNIVKR